jgi:hypothetical protein
MGGVYMAVAPDFQAGEKSAVTALDEPYLEKNTGSKNAADKSRLPWLF